MNVLLINIPTVSLDYILNEDANFAITIHPPEGLMYIAESIRDKDFIKNICLADFGILDYSKKEIFDKGLVSFFDDVIDRAIGECDIDIIGISLMFSSSYQFYQDLVFYLQSKFNNAVVVTGGNHATSTADYLIQNDLTDYVIEGEGENAFAKLVEIVYNEKTKNDKGSGGKIIKQDHSGKMNQSEYLSDLDIKNFERFYSLIDMESYVNNFKIFSLSKQYSKSKSFPIMASRGCPGLCTFCASKTIHGRKMRWRSVQNIIDQIEYLYRVWGNIICVNG